MGANGKQPAAEKSRAQAGSFRARLVDALFTTGPGIVIIIGMMLMVIGDPAGEYVIGGGVVLQLALLGWRLTTLRSREQRKRHKAASAGKPTRR